MSTDALARSSRAHHSTTVRSKQRTAKQVLGAVATVSPHLAGRLAARWFTTPGRHPRPGRERAVLARARPFNLQVDGKAIAAWTWGQGPAVLLVHGWEGRGAQLGAFVDPLRSLGRRVVTFDGPAHGDSEGTQTTPVGFARVIQQLDRLVGPFEGVIAHSFGAIATGWALHEGLDIERLALVSPGQLPSDAARVVVGHQGADLVRRVASLAGQRAGVTFEAVDSAARAAYQSPRTRIVHDREDRFVQLDYVQSLLADPAPTSLRITEGLGHHRILRDRDVVEDLVSFVTGADRARLAPAGPWQHLLTREDFGFET